MRLRRSVLAALLLLATCNEDHLGKTPGSALESSHAALGVVPASEVATWTRIPPPADGLTPRSLQTAAFDETRKVVVVFGGQADNSSASGRVIAEALPASNYLCEWDPAAGTWTNRASAGDKKPSPRAGSTMVFDSIRNKFVIFGGRWDTGAAGSSSPTFNPYENYQDTWEWDPATGTFTDRTSEGSPPDARSQHSMVFEKSTAKLLLFGGAVAGSVIFQGVNGASVKSAFGDTWEWDPTTGKWTNLTPATAPSARYDSAMIWDSTRNRAVLFGGMEVPPAGLVGIPKQDTWEWDPANPGWTNRTITGNKPSARYGHAMAYDAGRGLIVLSGGFDIATGNGLADLWEWDPSTAVWTQRLTGSEPNLPAMRMYASLVADSARNRLDLLAGTVFFDQSALVAPGNPQYGSAPSEEIWEMDPTAPAATAFTDRTPPHRTWPSAREAPALVFCPATGKMYMFGGSAQGGVGLLTLGDFWEWDGTSWVEIQSDAHPVARQLPAIAYDPVRKSLILFGGVIGNSGSSTFGLLGDTWEWDSSTRKWTELHPKSSPEPRCGHGMVTDSGRGKVLLIGGYRSAGANRYPIPGASPYSDDLSSGVWEWDGSNTTWTNRTPVSLAGAPAAPQAALLSFDDGRQKVFLLEDPHDGGDVAFWEWDPISGGWTRRNSGDAVSVGSSNGFPNLAYDGLRRRQVLVTWPDSTFEFDTNGPTLYQRLISSPTGPLFDAVMAFDSKRGVAVLFGGNGNRGDVNGTWEYKVTNLGNGEGCTAATASNCASGFCVEGVCCASAACSGACQSCAVAGHEGTCSSATAGTEVPGSCTDGQACDGSGSCKSKNGVTCSSASVCASGFCVDGVCCDSACDGKCVSCNQAMRAGKCSGYALGSDPESECGSGSGICSSTCNGAGACDSPQKGIQCGPCQICDGAGACIIPDPFACGPSDLVDSGAGEAGGTGGVGGASGTGGKGGAGGTSGTGGIGAGGIGDGGTIVGGAGSVGGASGRGGTIDVGPGGAGGVVGAGGSSSGTGGNTGTGGNGDGGSGSGAAGIGGSRDGGMDAISSDTGNSDGAKDSSALDAGSPRLGRKGCSCDLGQTSTGTLGLPFALLGVVFLCKRLRRRQLRVGAFVALFLAANCSDSNLGNNPRLESSHAALGTVPASESAAWTRVDVPPPPSPPVRYLQSAAFDESRNVLVVFGGLSGANLNPYQVARQDLWEWNPATSTWTDRTPSGSKPTARSGAGMVFDSARNKFVIFGGRSTTNFDLADTWEWDPATGAFTDRTGSGLAPVGRSQHCMVFEKSTGKVLLFGGGLAGRYYDGTGISLAFAETWEWDPATATWAQLAPAAGPSARYDSALVWDSERSRAVLFGGMRKDQANADGIPMQDTWEWDPAKSVWTERTTTGMKPSARNGHAMAYDPGRGMIVLVGGLDAGNGLADVWDWDPSTGAWAQRLTGSEPNLPLPRAYASLVTDSVRTRLDLVAGMVTFPDTGTGIQTLPTAELWELDPAKATFSQNLAPPRNAPSGRYRHAMAFYPGTGKTYVFGGQDSKAEMLDDLWEWDGSSWSEVAGDPRPAARGNTAMAYDPTRKSLILFSGTTETYVDSNTTGLGDTWEWQTGTRKWTQLHPAATPGNILGHGMVTDTGRAKILLFGDANNAVWEWDGAKTTWTNRTPVPVSVAPQSTFWQTQPGWWTTSPFLTFDEGLRKMFVFEGESGWSGTKSNSVFWLWDPATAGWEFQDSGDTVDLGRDPNASNYSPFPVFAYDSLRRRQVTATNAKASAGSTSNLKTWELDSKNAIWYLRTLSPGPTMATPPTMAFDSQRGVMVLFGGSLPGDLLETILPGDSSNADVSQTWEYKVMNLGNGEGCTAATASTCASGFCVEGVCCTVASCSGACQSCAVAGHEGACMLAAAGTEVPGSCSDGQACDGSGSCKSKNGVACSSASACASGFCADGVCCDSACDGKCVSCNQAARAGKCSGYAPGSDPENECGRGQLQCRSICNGAGACDYPQMGTPCGSAEMCDGTGLCFDPNAPDDTGGTGGNDGTGGAAGFGGTAAGGAGGRGGAGGFGGMLTGGTGGFGGVSASGFGGAASGGAGGHGGASAGGGSGAGGVTSGGGAVAGGGAIFGGVGGSGGSLSGGADGGIGTGGSGGRADGGRDSISPDTGNSDSRTDLLLPDVASVDGRRDASPADAGDRLRLGHGGCDCSLGHAATAARPVPAFALLSAALLLRRLRKKRGG